eukprot:2691711-Rhodomonas_salina.3
MAMEMEREREREERRSAREKENERRRAQANGANGASDTDPVGLEGLERLLEDARGRLVERASELERALRERFLRIHSFRPPRRARSRLVFLHRQLRERFRHCRIPITKTRKTEKPSKHLQDCQGKTLYVARVGCVSNLSERSDEGMPIQDTRVAVSNRHRRTWQDMAGHGRARASGRQRRADLTERDSAAV